MSGEPSLEPDPLKLEIMRLESELAIERSKNAEVEAGTAVRANIVQLSKQLEDCKLENAAMLIQLAELKAIDLCALCGSRADKFVDRSSVPDHAVYFVRCRRCLIRSNGAFVSSEAVRQWNDYRRIDNIAAEAGRDFIPRSVAEALMQCVRCPDMDGINCKPCGECDSCKAIAEFRRHYAEKI